MGIASVTTHPMKYMYMETIQELLDERYPQGLPQEDKGALHMTFDLANAPAQRRTAQILAEALQGKAVYLRDRDWKSVYDKYVVKGQVHTMADESYTSHNTNRLDVEGTVKKILTTDYVKEALANWEAGKA